VNKINIIPKPVKIDRVSGQVYTLPRHQVSINYTGFDDNSIKVFFERTNLEGVQLRQDKSDITIIKEKSFSVEEYELTVNDNGVVILASTDKGAIMAMTTLYQIMDREGHIPYCYIHDKPRYSHRGLSLDCARHFYHVDEIKRIIEQMALVKMNVFHWHLTDD